MPCVFRTKIFFIAHSHDFGRRRIDVFCVEFLEVFAGSSVASLTLQEYSYATFGATLDISPPLMAEAIVFDSCSPTSERLDAAKNKIVVLTSLVSSCVETDEVQLALKFQAAGAVGFVINVSTLSKIVDADFEKSKAVVIPVIGINFSTGSLIGLVDGFVFMIGACVATFRRNYMRLFP